MPFTDPPFDPSMPHPLALPWPKPWGDVTVVYDLYKCESYIDEQATYMADSQRALRALQAQRDKNLQLPEASAPRAAAMDEWNAAFTAWQRADRIRQLQYFVLRVEYPQGEARPGKDPATWARFPTSLIVWLADDGFAAARAALWPDPKAPTNPSPMPSTPPTPPATSVVPSPTTSASS